MCLWSMDLDNNTFTVGFIVFTRGSDKHMRTTKGGEEQGGTKKRTFVQSQVIYTIIFAHYAKIH
jgi:hypothetical protein